MSSIVVTVILTEQEDGQYTTSGTVLKDGKPTNTAFGVVLVGEVSANFYAAPENTENNLGALDALRKGARRLEDELSTHTLGILTNAISSLLTPPSTDDTIQETFDVAYTGQTQQLSEQET